MVTILAWPVLAATEAGLCDRAAQAAARKHGVPLDILRAVTRLETGRGRDGALHPWPWALNAGGTGYWLDSKTDAADKARAILATGKRNLDLGCFQLNFHWHGDQFANVDAMLDPDLNADYAARFLLSHYGRSGDWTTAIGAYHSRTPEHAQRYLARYHQIAHRLGPVLTATQQPAPPPRKNTYALLTGAGGGTHGSLVPVAALTQARPLIPRLEGAQ